MSITATNPGGSDGEESACNVETSVWTLGWEDSPGGGHHSPLQYSCLEGPHGQGSKLSMQLQRPGHYWVTKHNTAANPFSQYTAAENQSNPQDSFNMANVFFCVCGNTVLYYVSCAHHYILSSVIQYISLPTKCLVLSSITCLNPFTHFVFPAPSPLVTTTLFSVSVCLFCFLIFTFHIWVKSYNICLSSFDLFKLA